MYNIETKTLFLDESKIETLFMDDLKKGMRLKLFQFVENRK